MPNICEIFWPPINCCLTHWAIERSYRGFRNTKLLKTCASIKAIIPTASQKPFASLYNPIETVSKRISFYIRVAALNASLTLNLTVELFIIGQSLILVIKTECGVISSKMVLETAVLPNNFEGCATEILVVLIKRHYCKDKFCRKHRIYEDKFFQKLF